MAIRIQRIVQALWRGQAARPRGPARTVPAKIVLPPLALAAAAAKPPVRIFVGTEAAQFRAERVLLWSIERHRDPTRTYEIYLMKDLAGFHPLFWLTGFTNYRHAIPEFAGGAGRAIYNDVDQIYLADPATLFDAEMSGRGVLSIDDHDTSVMLIDCARMASLWNVRTAQTESRRALEAKMRERPGLWGRLDGAWNARDGEYVPGRSCLVHYTTIHAQPWRPTPRDYVYRSNPAAEVWFDLEREADRAGFHAFDAAHPSPDFPPELREEVRARARTASAEPAGGSFSALQGRGGPGDLAGRLVEVPAWDVPWVLDRLLQTSPQAVSVTIEPTRERARRAPADPQWWYAQMAAAGARTPGARWRLEVRTQRLAGPPRVRRWSGGPPLGRPPRTWVLLYHKTGHRSQAVGLAEALGLPFETREVGHFGRYLGATIRALVPFAPRGPAGGIAPPWPEIVIASGWLPGLVARRIARRHEGATRLVLLGRKAGPLGESQDIAVGCRHFRLPPEPRRLDLVLPLSKVSPARLGEAARRWPRLYDGRRRPRVVLLVGGACAQYRFDPEIAARLVGAVRERVDAAGGSLVVVASRRTGRVATEALAAGAGDDAVVDAWSPRSEDENPYLGYLAGADFIVVTGESESMLAEAVAARKPVYIYPLPARAPGWAQRLAEAVYRCATRDRVNARGTPRPQQGLQYLCARVLERRWLVPPRDLDGLHRSLVESGVARIFGEPFESWRPAPWRDAEAVADAVLELLGLPPRPGPAAIAKAA